MPVVDKVTPETLAAHGYERKPGRFKGATCIGHWQKYVHADEPGEYILNVYLFSDKRGPEAVAAYTGNLHVHVRVSLDSPGALDAGIEWFERFYDGLMPAVARKGQVSRVHKPRTLWDRL